MQVITRNHRPYPYVLEADAAGVGLKPRPRPRLVAHWSSDASGKLTCQWLTQ